MGAEDELIEARCNLEATRLEWDGLRYTLRCFELGDTREVEQGATLGGGANVT